MRGIDKKQEATFVDDTMLLRRHKLSCVNIAITLVAFQGSLLPTTGLNLFSSPAQVTYRYDRDQTNTSPLLKSLVRSQRVPHRSQRFYFATESDEIESDSKNSRITIDGENDKLTPEHCNNIRPPHYRRRSFFHNISLLLATTVIIPTTNILPSHAMYQDAAKKILLPSINEIETSIPKTWSPEDNPFREDVFDSRASFGRLNSSPDSIFYTDPRFVEHVDSNAVDLITRYLSSGGDVLKKKDAVLDLCTSWTSHIEPSTVQELQLTRVAGLGMNEEEMRGNKILTDYAVVDLNSKPKPADNPPKVLPYENESFDVVLCQLSIDYLVRPLEVMADVWRVMKPGGKVVIIFSNRLFLEKAVGLWTGADDVDHAYTVGAYLRFCRGNFIDIQAKDLSTRTKRGKEMVIVGDPLYVVTATRGPVVE